MNIADVREAAKLIQNKKVIANRYDDAADKLAWAWLKEHPADDEEAVDEAWLRAVGADVDRMPEEQHGPEMWYADFEDDEHVETYRLTIWQDGKASVDDQPKYLPCKTRGDVRLLARALGIPLKEQQP